MSRMNWIRPRRWVLGLALSLATTAAYGASAQDAEPTDAPIAAAASDDVNAIDAAEMLKPGQWTWTPEVAQEGSLRIRVDLTRQVAIVYRGGVRIGATTISSGREGYETPTGVFPILQKDANHHSKKYDNAPMPFTQRLTWDGVALHSGRVPGYPESHGCVHLPYGFAKVLFGATRIGETMVEMIGEAPSRAAALQARAEKLRSPMVTTDSSPVILASNR